MGDPLVERDGAPVLTVSAEEYRCVSVALNPDATLLAVGKSNGMVAIWDVPGARLVKHFLHDLMGGPVTAVAFSPDGWLLATVGQDGQLKLRNLKTGKLILRRQHPGPLRAVAFDAAAEQVATACADGAVRVWSKRGRLLADHPDACTPATRTIIFTGTVPVAADESRSPHAGVASGGRTITGAGCTVVLTDDGGLQVWTGRRG